MLRNKLEETDVIIRGEFVFVFNFVREKKKEQKYQFVCVNYSFFVLVFCSIPEMKVIQCFINL